MKPERVEGAYLLFRDAATRDYVESRVASEAITRAEGELRSACQAAGYKAQR